MNTIKGVKRKNSKLKKQIRPFDGSMVDSSADFDSKNFSTRVYDDGLYNADFLRQADIKDVIKGFQA